MFLLRTYRPDRYGKSRDRLPPPECEECGEEYSPEDPGMTLEGELTGVEFLSRDVPGRGGRR